MEKDHTFATILVAALLGGCTTILIFVAEYSRMSALCLTWAPIILLGTYLIGKKVGREE